MYHGFCNTGGCHVDAKNSTAVTTIPRAQATNRFKAVTGATVTSINVDSQGRASGVTYLSNGEEFFQPAKVVLVASFCYENSRLLLLSKSPAFPNGLSNNHGQVGKHYFSHHQGGQVSALFPFNIGAWYGLPAQGVAVDDWADDNFDHSPVDFIGGGNLWAMSDRRPITAAGMITKIVGAIAGLKTEIQSLKSFPEIAPVRDAQLTHLRATGKFPDYLDVGTNVWFAIHDWHIRWQQPLTLGRDNLGRYTLLFGQTYLIMTSVDLMIATASSPRRSFSSRTASPVMIAVRV